MCSSRTPWLTPGVTRLTTTADLRAPEGLDDGARRALLRLLRDAGHTHDGLIVAFFRQEAWGDLEDYLGTVDTVYEADGLGARIREEMRAMPARYEDQYATLDHEKARRMATQAYAPLALLLNMPEADFLSVVAAGVATTPDPFQATGLPGGINKVCARRGVQFRMEGVGAHAAFKWVGDEAVERDAIRPALSALDDPRLHSARRDFDSARQELREGKPSAWKLAVAEGCNAVESGLRALLVEHGLAVPPKADLGTLLKACRAAGMFPESVDGKSVPINHVLGAAGRFGNERGRHGSEVPHDVEPYEAEAVVAAAAVALALIARRLPVT
jgi:hypothetical protein